MTKIPRHLPSPRAWTGASVLVPVRAAPGGVRPWMHWPLPSRGRGPRGVGSHPILRYELKRHQSCPLPGFQDQIGRKVGRQLVLRWEAHSGMFRGSDTRRPMWGPEPDSGSEADLET